MNIKDQFMKKLEICCHGFVQTIQPTDNFIYNLRRTSYNKAQLGTSWRMPIYLYMLIINFIVSAVKIKK